MEQEKNKKTVVRCRGIIVNNDRLLGVKHTSDSEHYALPGGHLEWGENIHDCLKREIIEELGVEPQIGRLLYINNYIDTNSIQSIEFFFEIINSDSFIEIDKLGGTHKHELFEICWINKNDSNIIYPKKLQSDLNDGAVLSDTVRIISSI
jgi:ADP-ribose pyrophosphatase YjhB (NUDIX family)